MKKRRSYSSSSNRAAGKSGLGGPASVVAPASPIVPVMEVTEGSPDGNTFTTANGNSTGATLLIVAVSFFIGAGDGVLTDAKGNTWVPLTGQNASTPYVRLYYCENPIVGSGHWFRWTAVGTNLGCISAWGFENAGAYDARESGATGLVETLQPGSLTPSEPNCLVFIALGSQTNGGDSVNSGFTIGTRIPNTANHISLSAAWLVQEAAAAVNPTYATNLGFGQQMAVAMAVFKHA